MRLAGTKRKHKHDTLHLLSTARKKIDKAYRRLPVELTEAERAVLMLCDGDIRDSLSRLVVEAHRRIEA